MIRGTRKRLVIITTVLVLLTGILVVTWRVCDWPPPRLILKYGLPPAGGPTGRRMTVEGMEFIELSAGYFRMGSHTGCTETSLIDEIRRLLGSGTALSRRHAGYECPPHWVEIPHPIWVGRSEVTNLQYERFDREHERCEYSMGDHDPVVDVSWEDAVRFCSWLLRETGKTVRLPSEAEWEFVARAGDSSHSSDGVGKSELDGHAWFEANSSERAHEVGTRGLNRWGFTDLQGNVAEWCQDRWHYSYSGAPRDSTPWLAGNSEFRVMRGGHFASPAEELRFGYRTAWTGSSGWVYIGIRLVREPRRAD
ncbi:MAG: formylglycine-generating enzyme family protein [Planctomycetota bacterium]